MLKVIQTFHLSFPTVETKQLLKQYSYDNLQIHFDFYLN